MRWRLLRNAIAAALIAGLAVGATACEFHHGAAAARDGAPYAGDATIAVTRWAIVSIDNPVRKVMVIPMTDTKLEPPCAPQPVSYAYRYLYPRPASGSYVYGVQGALEGLTPSCTGITETALPRLGGPRLVQQIVMDATSTVGFFTIDGSGATGVYRFTAASDGAPTVMDMANTPSQGGALALSTADAELYVAGTNLVYRYALVGSALDLPTSFTSGSGCAAPVGLALSGTSLLAFCADSPDIWHYTRSPFGYTGSVGSPGASSQVVDLGNDTAVIARLSPPTLAMVGLGGGTPTWTDGPALPGPAIAMAASADGQVLLTARAIDTSTSEIALWTIAGQTITLQGTTTVNGVVAALAVTQPGA